MRNFFVDKTVLALSVSALLFIGGAAALAVYQPVAAIALIGAVIVLATFPFTKLYVAVTAVSLPLSAVLAAATPIGYVALCDVTAMIAIASFCMSRIGNDKGPLQANRGELLLPVRLFIGLAIPYFAVSLYSVLTNDGQVSVAVQRVELIIVWLIFGALLFQSKSLNLFIKWFIGCCVVLSLAWIAAPGVGGVLGIQKNPSGGFISAALIMLILSRVPNVLRFPGIVVLCGGLLSTGSRGSMLGIGVAAVLLILFIQQWRRIFVPFFVAGVGSLVAFVSLPSHVTARILSQDDAGAYNIDIRGLFVTDALDRFREAPWSGVGVGNYMQQHPGLLSVQTHDPHNVFALSLAEGGYPLLIGFVVMSAGPLLWLLGKRKTSIVALAIAVQTSTLVHAFVDVYWVRGTPAVGWLLVGAAAAYLFVEGRTSEEASVGSPNDQTRLGRSPARMLV